MNSRNRTEFTKPILEFLSTLPNEKINDDAKTRLFVLIRRLANELNEAQKRRLAMICLQQLGSEIYNLSGRGGARTNTNIQAIYALSICGSPEDMKKLKELHDKKRYLSACLYAHSKTRTEIDWIIEQFLKDSEAVLKNFDNSLNMSGHAVAVALQNDSGCDVDKKKRVKVLNKLIEVINSTKLKIGSLTVCILAVGTMCDKRTCESPFSDKEILEADSCVSLVSNRYNKDLAQKVERNCQVALKLIRGEKLDESEEKYLLTKLELLNDSEI